MKIETLKKTVYLFSIILLAFFMLFIVIFTLGNFDYADYTSSFLRSYVLPVYLLTGSIFIFAFVYMIGYKITSYSQKQMRNASVLIGVMIFTVQMLLVYFIRSPLRSDPGMVFDQALSMLKTKTVSPTAIENYFSIYPNNIPLCIFEYFMLKLGNFFGLKYEHYLLYIDSINVVMIDLAMFFAYQIIKIKKDAKAAVKFLILCAFNPLIYAYSVLVYTSTLSMPFILGGIYFYIKVRTQEKTLKKYLYIVLTTLTLYMGFKLRVTVLITFIAIVLHFLMQMQKKLENEKLINIAKKMILIILTLVIAAGIYQGIERTYVKFDYSKTGFPVTHWLMMGAQGSGGFNTEDFNYTLSFNTKEERIQANLLEYKKRIQNMGVKGLIQLSMNKLKATWSDGLDATIDTLSANKTYSKLNDYLTGSKKDIYVSYCHMYHLMLMCMVLIHVIKGFKKSYKDFDFIVYLNVLGGIVFHLFWEAGAAYNICFTFLVLILANDGMEEISSFIARDRMGRKVALIGSLFVIATVLFLVVGYKNMVQVPYKQHEIAANQDFHDNEYEPLMKGDELIQTFVTSRSFDRLGVKVRNFTGDSNASIYKMELLNEDNQVLASSDIVGSLAYDTDYYRMPIDTITPESPTTYKLKITTKEADENNNIVFMKYNTGNWNVYEDGTFYINEQETLGSLTFLIYHSIEQSFFSFREYMIGSILLIVGELGLIVSMIGIIKRKY